VNHQVKQLWQAIRQRAIWMPALFLFLWQATPTADAAFFFFTTNDLGFQPEFLGRVRLVTSVAALLGIWVFQRFLRTVPFRTIFAWSTVLSSVLGMSMLLLVTHVNRSLGIGDEWFSLGDSLVLTVMGKSPLCPCWCCRPASVPPGVEATLFALLMSVVNLAGLLSHELGALLTHWLGVTETNFDHLWQLVLITNLTTLLPLPLLFLLPNSSSQGVGIVEAAKSSGNPPIRPQPPPIRKRPLFNYPVQEAVFLFHRTMLSQNVEKRSSWPGHPFAPLPRGEGSRKNPSKSLSLNAWERDLG
jgi:folate/biopterin transporter